MIGHIQTNKVKYLAPYVSLIHSLDSLRLAKEIDKQAVKNKRVIECLIQYRISSEETKFGLNENEVLEIIKLKDNFKGIKIIGLMGMASFVDDQNIIDNEFKKLKILFDKIKLSNKKFKIVSMGMTLDYNLAIKNGSNMIRIGSKILGKEMYKNFAILDVETTGGKFNQEKITDISILIYDGIKIINRFETLINPDKEIQPFVQRLTGINNELVRNSPRFKDVSKKIFEITKNKIIVAHNVDFDYRIIKNEFQNINMKYLRDSLCTVDLSKLIFPNLKSYKLTNLLSNFGIVNQNPHRANSDALGALELFKILVDKDLDMKVIKSRIKSNKK